MMALKLMDDVPFHMKDVTASHMDDVIPSNADASIIIHKDDVSLTWLFVAYINGDTATHLDGMAITHVNAVPAKPTGQCAFNAHMDSLPTVQTSAVIGSFPI